MSAESKPEIDSPDAREQVPVAPTVEPAKDMPLPDDPKLVFLAGLFLIAALAGAYFAREVLLPIVLAFILKLLFQPIMRLLSRVHVPRVVASLAVILIFLGIMVGLGELLSTPAANWAKRLPEGLPRLEQRVQFISAPLKALSRFLAHAGGMVSGGANNQATPAAPGMDLQGSILSGVQVFASGFFSTLLVLFFLLMSGDTLLRRLVEVMPSFGDKRQVIDIAQQVETDISAYLLTITGMNLLVGIVTGLAMWALGLQDALLWGAIAFLLNYVPILGPLVGLGLFLAVGMLSLDPLWKAFMPMALYAGIHLIEGETVTPILLAQRFILNPVLVIIALLFWDWMWGVPGAILAVPMLAITKVICDRIVPLAAFGHFLEGKKQAMEP